MKEEFGMLLDSSFYEKSINDFILNFKEIFSENVKLEDKFCDIDNKGYFKIVFQYLPLNYNIIIENEIRTFTITIEDEGKAKNSLYRIERFDNTLGEENIKKALCILKKILDKNQFSLYLYKDKRLYKKNNNKLKRVKDLKELLNE